MLGLTLCSPSVGAYYALGIAGNQMRKTDGSGREGQSNGVFLQLDFSGGRILRMARYAGPRVASGNIYLTEFASGALGPTSAGVRGRFVIGAVEN